MDDRRFDNLTRWMARPPSRRAFLRGLTGGLLGASLALVGGDRAEARCFRQRRRCRYHRQCCSGRCREGACAACPNGKTACGGACVDTRTSAAHCGGCDAPCATSCVDGVCLPCARDADCPPPRGGSARCVDNVCAAACDDGDQRVCGAAPGVCQSCCGDDDCPTDSGQVCQNGACACPSDRPRVCSGVCRECCNDLQCPRGRLCLDNRCVQNSGTCPNRDNGCPPSQPDGCNGDAGCSCFRLPSGVVCAKLVDRGCGCTSDAQCALGLGGIPDAFCLRGCPGCAEGLGRCYGLCRAA